MKKLTVSLAALAMVLAGNALARDKSKTTTTTTTTETRTAASTSGGGGFDIAFGLSTYGGGDPLGTPALSAKFNLGAQGSVQVLFGLTSSSPFQFGAGAIYRHRIFGDGDPGFHVGAGANLGTTAGGVGGTAFFMNVFPVAGFHFPLGGSLRRITLTFDGGLNFHITPGFQLQAGPISPVVGGAIHYQL